MDEKKITKKLWGDVNNTIKQMGRSDRLYTVDPEKSALLVIDMQYGLCSPRGCLENPDTRQIVPNINLLADKCREKSIPVIWIRFVVKKGENDGLWPLFQPSSPYQDRKNPAFEFSESGTENRLWHELKVDKKKDLELIKNRYSALISGSSDLEKTLRNMGKDTVIITGVGTNVCCESTARDAMMLNFKVIFVGDANATIGKLAHEMTLMNVKLFFGDVVKTKELMAELK